MLYISTFLHRSNILIFISFILNTIYYSLHKYTMLRWHQIYYLQSSSKQPTNLKLIIYNFYFVQSMKHSRIAVIEGHNKDSKTDQLYEPLRKTLLQDTTSRKSQLQEASRISQVSRIIKTHTYAENIKLGEHTFIPEDVRLKPTHNVWKIPKDHTYCIINVQNRIYDPISQQQLDRHLKGAEEEIIVYTYQDEDYRGQIHQRFANFEYQTAESKLVYENRFEERKSQLKNEAKSWLGQTYVSGTNRPVSQSKQFSSPPNRMKQEVSATPTIQVDKVQNIEDKLALFSQNKKIEAQNEMQQYSTRKRKGSGINVTQSKYNLFSAIDEPINNLLSGKSCTCPANQIVADKINEISWYDTLKR